MYVDLIGARRSGGCQFVLGGTRLLTDALDRAAKLAAGRGYTSEVEVRASEGARPLEVEWRDYAPPRTAVRCVKRGGEYFLRVRKIKHQRRAGRWWQFF